MTSRHTAYLLDDPSTLDGLTTYERLMVLVMAHNADRGGIVRYPLVDCASAMGASKASVSTWALTLTGKGFLKKLGHGRYQLGEVFTDAEEPPAPAGRGRRR